MHAASSEVNRFLRNTGEVSEFSRLGGRSTVAPLPLIEDHLRPLPIEWLSYAYQPLVVRPAVDLTSSPVGRWLSQSECKSLRSPAVS
jgi:hypothetical protein